MIFEALLPLFAKKNLTTSSSFQGENILRFHPTMPCHGRLVEHYLPLTNYRHGKKMARTHAETLARRPAAIAFSLFDFAH